MLKTLIPVLGALLLCASLGLQAQTAPAAGARARDAHRNAAEVCKTRPSAEQRECMREEMCRRARDPARCEENAKKNAERRDKVLEACKGKQGTVLRQCMREEYKKLPPQK
jgi:hypothetical protein